MSEYADSDTNACGACGTTSNKNPVCLHEGPSGIAVMLCSNCQNMFMDVLYKTTEYAAYIEAHERRRCQRVIFKKSRTEKDVESVVKLSRDRLATLAALHRKCITILRNPIWVDNGG